MKKLFIGIAAVFLILIVAICALPFLVPASTYGNVAETRLEAMLGRDVTLESDPKVTIFPRLGARIDNVEIANAEGFDDPYFAKAGSLSIAVKWLPLFSRKVEIASLRFADAEVLLQQKSATENNWTFAPSETRPRLKTVQKPLQATLPSTPLFHALNSQTPASCSGIMSPDRSMKRKTSI